MKYHALALSVGALLSTIVESNFTPARPPAIPLAVRSPYMNTWLEVGSDGGSNGVLPGYWPSFWAGPQPGPVGGTNGAVTGWVGFIKVDGASFTWMGAPGGTSVTQESFEYTSTRSSFIMNVAGKLSMNVSFISPVSPTNFKRQSIIGTYLDVKVASIDGASHSVQLYTDISAEWVNPTHNNEPVKWSYSTENGVASHMTQQQVQSEFNADYPDDAAHWGNWYWSTKATKSMSYQSGRDETVRGIFLNNGKLPNTQDSNFRAISDNWPVFAFANDLGSVGTTPVITLYTIVHAQKNAVLYNGATGEAGVPSLWTSYFENDLAMVEFFYKDFPNEIGKLDHLIATDSLAIGGPNYHVITALSVREAFAGTQLVGTSDKAYLFLKEISSDGNCQTVDVIFPAMPMFLYLNPKLVKLLLDPLYENQEAGKFPMTYSIHDLGANYPRAIGHPTGDGEPMPLEECGNMIIMTLAYAQRARDSDYLAAHYPILTQWVGYLVVEALIPANQLSTDDFQGELTNQTNLALKGIIAIKAMSVIAHLTGHTNDQKKYSDIALDYITRWQELAIVRPYGGAAHTNLAYGDSLSHGLLYNLYADRLLGLNLVPQSVYNMQSSFYPTIAQTYGVQLDSRNLATKSDWEMWVAAIASPSTQNMFMSKLVDWINTTSTNRAFTDLYNTQTGSFWNGPFIARPVVGGHFAPLALKDAPRTAGHRRSRFAKLTV